MTEPHKTDHWASLASNLGAEPAPEEPQERGSRRKRRRPVCQEQAGSGARRRRPPFRAGGQARTGAPPPGPCSGLGSIGRRLGNCASRHRLRLRRLRKVPSPAVERPAASLPCIPAVSHCDERHSRQRCLPRTRRRSVEEAEAAMAGLGRLEPSATEPESFEPQEALDIMDETADEFGDEESEEDAAATVTAGEKSAGERKCHGRSRTTIAPPSPPRRGRGRGREEAPATMSTWRRR